MNQAQFGSFKVQSQTMLNLLKYLDSNRDKKYFVVTGEAGSGKSVMCDFINKTILNNAVVLKSGDSLPEKYNSIIIETSKEEVQEFLKKFPKNESCVIEMPALCERKADILPFADFFLQVLSLMHNKKSLKLTDKAAEKLLQYNWPGHFHELESVLEDAYLNAIRIEAKTNIEPENINLKFDEQEPIFNVGLKLDEVERKYILQTLYFVHQNRTKAAEILGISIRTLRNKINQYREEGYL